MKTKKKKWFFCYVAVLLVILLIPSLGMTVAQSHWTTETTPLAEAPSFTKEDGSLNENILEDAGNYFEDHFAFRPELITINSMLQSTLLHTSSTDQILVGEDGWLYFAGSKNDYQLRNPMSDRELYNVAYNLKLIQSYYELCGMDFLFTVPPNKASLYPEHMPYYLWPGEGETNLERLTPLLEEMGIHYVDLLEAFREQDDCLYFKQDSHWNNQGALLAYNQLMEATSKTQWETYQEVPYVVEKNHSGDLAEMIYPQAVELEENYIYQKDWEYSYQNEVEDNMAQWIETANPNQTGTLYMYRDSFGESLLPFLAEEYGQAYFSRLVPYSISNAVAYGADTVILERAERNLSGISREPALMQAPTTQVTTRGTAVDSATTLEISQDGAYWRLEGLVDPSLFEEDTQILIRIHWQKTGLEMTYQPFYQSVETDQGVQDNGYLMYLLSNEDNAGPVEVEVILSQDEGYQVVKTLSTTLEFSE